MTQTETWDDLARNGRTLEAIVAYRAQMGTGLSEAKAAVEAWVEINLPPPVDYQLASAAAERLHRLLSRYAETVRPLSYTMHVVCDRPDHHSGHPTLLTGEFPENHSGRDLAVLFPLSGVPRKFTRQEAEEHIAAGTAMVMVIEIEDQGVTVMHRGGNTYQYLLGATIDGGDVIPGFTCKVADLIS